MLESLLNTLFGCSHSRITFPLTPSRKMATSANRHGTYVVCLDCGKEFAYDWREMKVIEDVPAYTARVRELATKQAG